MADPIRPFFVISLFGQNSNPMIPDSYISNHFKDKIHSTKLKLTSDASDTTWEVKLDGGRFSDGWKEFSVLHCVRNDDVLSFRQDGDMIFHVTPLGRTFSRFHFNSPTSNDDNDDDDDDERNIFDDYDDDDDQDDVVADDVNWTSEEDLYTKKRAREEETESSYLVVHVTHSSLRRDHMCITKDFARLNDLEMRKCEIDLINEHDKSWTLHLNFNKSTGQVFIYRGWGNFCSINGIKAGTFCRFKLVQNGTKPVLRLCPNNGNPFETQKVSQSEGGHNKIVTIDFKPYMFRSSQLRLPPLFTKVNGIEEEGDVTVVNKDGVVWKSHLVNIKGRDQLYISCCRALFIANGIGKDGDSFTLEVIKGGTSPILKFFPKVKEGAFDGYKIPRGRPRKIAQETETRVEKRARVSTEPGPSRHTIASSADHQGNLQCNQPIQPCSTSDQVTKVKQSIVDTLTTVRRFMSELEIKEHNLEASLLDIDVLGEKIMEISKILNFNQV